jgi:hypothetical protein
MSTEALEQIRKGLETGQVVPYVGPGMLELAADCPVPASPESLVERLVAKASVPHKIRGNLTAAAQFIENFKHRKTVSAAMTEAFSAPGSPASLHSYLAQLQHLPLIVHAWYDDLMRQAMEARAESWGMIQGVSQAEHFGTWDHYFSANGEAATPPDAEGWSTILYEPIGAVRPDANFIVSDSDYVEVLTEIDIQTPIPPEVQTIRTGRWFLFLGCRFRSQLERAFARQIMKRSSHHHVAVLPGELSRNEARFLKEQNIERIDMPLAEFASLLLDHESPSRLVAEVS